MAEKDIPHPEAKHQDLPISDFLQRVELLAAKYDMAPKEIMNRIRFIGLRIAEEESEGGRAVIIRPDKPVIKINFYANHSNSKNGTSVDEQAKSE
jgi:hypothetical protein